jgi:hypothetical protein
MANDPSERSGDAGATVPPRERHDVHDIRALTHTGAIPLPERGASRTTDRSRRER